MDILSIDKKTVEFNLVNLKNLVFEVTEKCCLACKYCGLSDRLYDQHDQRFARDLNFEKAKHLIDYLSDLWKRQTPAGTSFPFVIGFYGGEPLLNMHLIRQIVEYVEKRGLTGRRVSFAMTTNAMLLDRYMDYLVEKQFHIAISLDGDENGQSYRVDLKGENSFNRVIRNVRLFQQTYPEYFKRAEVNFISVLHNRNDVEPILDFFNKYFDKVPIILPLNTSSVSEEKKDEFRKMYQNKLQSLHKSSNCERIEDQYFLDMPKGLYLSQNLYHTSGNIFYTYNNLLMEKYRTNTLSTGTCTPFSKKLFLSASGKILPCERIDHDFSVGQVYDDHVELDLQVVADNHNMMLHRMSGQCARCAANQFCPKCIYHIDDIRNRTAHCKDFYTKEKYEKESKYAFDYLRQHPQYYDRILHEVSFTL